MSWEQKINELHQTAAASDIQKQKEIEEKGAFCLSILDELKVAQSLAEIKDEIWREGGVTTFRLPYNFHKSNHPLLPEFKTNLGWKKVGLMADDDKDLYSALAVTSLYFHLPRYIPESFSTKNVRDDEIDVHTEEQVQWGQIFTSVVVGITTKNTLVGSVLSENYWTWGSGDMFLIKDKELAKVKIEELLLEDIVSRQKRNNLPDIGILKTNLEKIREASVKNPGILKNGGNSLDYYFKKYLP